MAKANKDDIITKVNFIVDKADEFMMSNVFKDRNYTEEEYENEFNSIFKVTYQKFEDDDRNFYKIWKDNL